jgi:hypothetical protein
MPDRAASEERHAPEHVFDLGSVHGRLLAGSVDPTITAVNTRLDNISLTGRPIW